MKRYAQYTSCYVSVYQITAVVTVVGLVLHRRVGRSIGWTAANDGMTSVSNSRFGRNDNWIKMSGKIKKFLSLNI